MKELVLETDTKEAIWFPPELKKQIKIQAAKEGLTMWRYIAMLHNNYRIYKHESKKK